MTADLLAELEKINKTATEAVHFTYTPLSEVAALQ